MKLYTATFSYLIYHFIFTVSFLFLWSGSVATFTSCDFYSLEKWEIKCYSNCTYSSPGKIFKVYSIIFRKCKVVSIWIMLQLWDGVSGCYVYGCGSEVVVRTTTMKGIRTIIYNVCYTWLVIVLNALSYFESDVSGFFLH